MSGETDLKVKLSHCLFISYQQLIAATIKNNTLCKNLEWKDSYLSLAMVEKRSGGVWRT